MANKTMMFSRTATLYCVLLCFNMGYSQAVSDILQKISSVYTATMPLQYRATYNLYKDASSKKIEDHYQGVFYKNDQNETFVKIGPTQIWNTKKAYLRINDDEKMVEVRDPLGSYAGEFEMEQLLAYAKVEKCVAFAHYWEMTLVVKPLAGLPYSKIIVQVNKNYFLKKQIFYYTTATNFSKAFQKSEIGYPRLEIIYDDFSRVAVNSLLFKTNSYYSLSAKNGIVLSSKLQGYELLDERSFSSK